MSALFLLIFALTHCFGTAAIVLLDLFRSVRLVGYSRRALAAENVFLRKQLALFEERKVKPHRADDATRWLMVTVSRLFDWRMSLIVVKPDTFIRQTMIFDNHCRMVGDPEGELRRILLS